MPKKKTSGAKKPVAKKATAKQTSRKAVNSGKTPVKKLPQAAKKASSAPAKVMGGIRKMLKRSRRSF